MSKDTTLNLIVKLRRRTFLYFVRTFRVFCSGTREQETTEISTGQKQVQGHTDGQHVELEGTCSLWLFLLYRSVMVIKFGQVAAEMKTLYTGLAAKENVGISSLNRISMYFAITMFFLSQNELTFGEIVH